MQTGVLFRALLVALGVAAGNQTGSTSPQPDYVALGSSFAAGPDVGRPDPEALRPCGRSLDNYAHKLAARRNLTLDDRTCSGAKTDDVMSRHQFGLPPQNEAVGPSTRLVTITVGGNDVSYLGDLAAASCRNEGNDKCQTSPSETLDARFSALREAMANLLVAVKVRAPSAKIVVVDYVTIVPEVGDCPEHAPLTHSDMTWVRARAERLRRLTADVAAEAGALLVKASDLSTGHDVCAAKPWVNGWRDPGPTGRPLAVYHPRAEAMEAIAEALDRQLPRSIGSSK